MTDVMPERQAVDVDELADGEPAGAGVLDAVDEQLIARLAGRGRGGGLQLAGEGGLLAQLTKRLVESALEGEITDHLGYDRHDAAGRDGRNSRNGHRSKTVLIEVGPVEIDVPRDRDGSFEPKIVAKRKRRLSGVDELVISLSAKGLTTGDVQAHLAEVYGAEGVAPDHLDHYRQGDRGHGRVGQIGRWTRSIRWCSSTRSTSRSGVWRTPRDRGLGVSAVVDRTTEQDHSNVILTCCCRTSGRWSSSP